MDSGTLIYDWNNWQWCLPAWLTGVSDLGKAKGQKWHALYFTLSAPSCIFLTLQHSNKLESGQTYITTSIPLYNHVMQITVWLMHYKP